MKLKQLFLSILAGAAVFFSCTPEEPISTLADFNIDKSYIGFVTAGGTVTTNVDAATAWSIDVTTIPDWLTVSPVGGGVGSTQISFTVGANEGDQRSKEIKVKVGNETQIITVAQDGTEPAVLKIADIIAMAPGLAAGTIPEQTVIVKGIVCMIKEISTSYGNATYFLSDDGTYSGNYAADGTGDANWFEVYRGYWIDGEKFTKGDEFAVGDEITVKGTLMSYYGTPETAQNASEVLAHVPSLIDVAPFDFEKLPAIDTVFNMVVTAKESPLLVTSDADWLKIESVNPDGSYKLHAYENQRTAERTANVTIKGPTALKSIALTQKGAPATGATVSEIIAMEDGSLVQTVPSTVVVALTTKGAILSDGTKAIYAYGDMAAALEIGNGVKMNAKKTTYNGVPELTDITDVFIDQESVPYEYPTATDVTATATTYSAAEAEYIKLTGTLKVSGNYYNLELDGVDPATKQGSIVYPVDELEAKSFADKKITVTGYFNGLSGKGVYLNIIATGIVEFIDNPKGTIRNPYDASELAELMKGGTIPEGEVYARGIINKVDNVNLQYGNAQYWLSTDGKTADLEVYRGFWYDGAQFTSEDQIKAGDEVVVYGKVKVFNGTPEFDANNYIYTLNGKANPTGEGTADSPYNVTKLADLLLSGETPANEVYAKGIISQIDNVNLQYGNAQYWISDDGGNAYQVEIYRGFWFGGDKFTSADQIAVGDEVVVYGKVKMYNNTPEFDANNKIISLNGRTE